MLDHQVEIRLEGAVKAGVVQGDGAQVGRGLEKTDLLPVELPLFLRVHPEHPDDLLAHQQGDVAFFLIFNYESSKFSVGNVEHDIQQLFISSPIFSSVGSIRTGNYRGN